MNKGYATIFVSYSRFDERLVTPIVQVLRAVGGVVFQDIDSIPFGKRWRPVIEDSLDRARIVFVFWCEHSRKSREVRKEWSQAVDMGKDVIPTLLDDTPLDPVLSEYQAIDLRVFAAVHARSLDESRKLMPVEFERWKRRHIDTDHANHLCHLDSDFTVNVALQMLQVVEDHCDRITDAIH